MKQFAIILSLLIGSVVQAGDFLKVSQQLTVPYWSEHVAAVHLKRVFAFFDAELRKHDCLEGESDWKITEEAKSRIFGRDIPGKLLVTYRTRCYEKALTSVRFSVPSFGYDEDYTYVTLELGIKDLQKELSQMCVYGLDGDVKKCRSYPKNPVFSTEIDEAQVRRLKMK